jgi:hypothetical protein
MFVEVFTKRLINVKREAKERIEKAQREGLCLACLKPIADGEETLRGAHSACYQATYRAISAGKTTWEERIAEGKIGPAKTGRKPSNPVSAEFA